MNKKPFKLSNRSPFSASILTIICFSAFIFLACSNPSGGVGSNPWDGLDAGLYLGEPSSLTKTSDPIAGVHANDLDAAVNYAKTNASAGEYTLLLGAVISADTQDLNTAYVKLTIIGLKSQRTIKNNGTGRLFTINAEGVRLTLGKNITLNGNSVLAPLVYVQNGSLEMLAGSKITGHKTGASDGTVCVNGVNAVFTMYGGEISGNQCTASQPNIAFGVGGVCTTTNGSFIMKGGKVVNNTSTYSVAYPQADVMIFTSASITLSGNAQAGTLILQLIESTPGSYTNSSVSIAGQYSGSVKSLDLIGRNDQYLTYIHWKDRPVISPVGSYTLKQNDIARIKPGRFRMSGDNNPVSMYYSIVLVGNHGVLKN